MNELNIILVLSIVTLAIGLWLMERRITALEHKIRVILVQLPLPELEMDSEEIDALLDNLDRYDANLNDMHGPAVLRLVHGHGDDTWPGNDKPYDYKESGL